MGDSFDALDISESKKRYVRDVINPLLEDMVMDSLFAAKLDENPTNYLLAWSNLRQAATNEKCSKLEKENAQLRSKIAQCERSVEELGKAIIREDVKAGAAEEEEPEEDDELMDEEELAKKMPQPKGGMRTSVSAEAYGEWNKKQDFTPPVYPKSDGQKQRLIDTLAKSFMFQALEKRDLDTVIAAMQEVNAKKGMSYVRPRKGDMLIKLGDQGDFLFVVEKGALECRKEIDGEDKLLKTVGEGDAFGELSLLYNAPRAANVIANQECTLWKLDRMSFNAIVKDAAQKKRDKYEGFLSKVPLLKNMEKYQRSQVADGLVAETIAMDSDIITQGADGDKFYILEEGRAAAYKDGNKVLEYNPGDFFGELALLRNAPRAASVKAEYGEARVLSLNRGAFKRLFGGAAELQALESQAATYN